MKIRHILLLIVVLLATGCASGPAYKDYADQIQSVSSDMGRVYFYRSTSMGAAVQPKIRMNDEVVGTAVPKGFFFADKPAGDYEISAKTEAKRSLKLKLEAGEEKYVRLEMKMGFMVGHVKPVLVDSEVGKKEIKKTKYIGK